VGRSSGRAWRALHVEHRVDRRARVAELVRRDGEGELHPTPGGGPMRPTSRSGSACGHRRGAESGPRVRRAPPPGTVRIHLWAVATGDPHRLRGRVTDQPSSSTLVTSNSRPNCVRRALRWAREPPSGQEPLVSPTVQGGSRLSTTSWELHLAERCGHAAPRSPRRAGRFIGGGRLDHHPDERLGAEARTSTRPDPSSSASAPDRIPDLRRLGQPVLVRHAHVLRAPGHLA